MSKEDIQLRFDNVSKSKTFRNIVGKFDLGNKSVFDIGCTYGEFLSHFGKGSTGVTIVREETEAAIKRGLNVVTGNIEDPNFSVGSKFDAIFANNIFEHLHSPHIFLINIKSSPKIIFFG